MLEDRNFERNSYSRTAVGVYKIGHDSKTLFEWLVCDRFYYCNLNYFDLMGFICKNLKLNEIPGW